MIKNCAKIDVRRSSKLGKIEAHTRRIVFYDINYQPALPASPSRAPSVTSGLSISVQPAEPTFSFPNGLRTSVQPASPIGQLCFIWA